MSSWDKKLNSVTAVERRFASHPNSTNAAVVCRFYLSMIERIAEDLYIKEIPECC